jgi:hypothetical protein
MVREGCRLSSCPIEWLPVCAGQVDPNYCSVALTQDFVDRSKYYSSLQGWPSPTTEPVVPSEATRPPFAGGHSGGG